MCIVTNNLEIDLSEITERDDLGLENMPVSLVFAGEYETYYKVQDQQKEVMKF